MPQVAADPSGGNSAGRSQDDSRHGLLCDRPTPAGAAGAAPNGEGTTSFLRAIPLPLEEPAPTRIGRYRIQRVLGQGGMGVVYEAEQAATGRSVALKVVHPHLATPRWRRRFAEEIRALARFEHPGIARIHDAGVAPDDHGVQRLYFAMELVRGLRIDEHVAAGRAAGRSAGGRGATAEAMSGVASLMAAVCDAAHHAHQKGVIHCDLKPANILVDDDGGPRILDFGIARIVGDEALDALATLTGGGVLGTLAFASPEQALADRSRIDLLTDVYGLGAVLYATIAGRPPHEISGRGLADAMRIVRDVPPQRLRALRPGCPEELETLAAKAMAALPADRYDSAAAMAADLRRFIAGHPIVARPASCREVAWKWVRRNRLAAASLATAAAILLVGVVAVTATLFRLRGALTRVQFEQRSHARTHRALQGAQLFVNDRHQHSRVLTESFDLPGHPGCVLAALDWTNDELGGQAPGSRRPSRLLTLDEQGGVIDRLDVPVAWPAWTAPCSDLNGHFRRAVERPQEATTVGALSVDLDGNGTPELLRCLRIHNDDLHLSLLRIDGLAAAVRARGASTPSTIDLWSHGDFIDIAWDRRRRLLWTLTQGDELPFVEPALAAWDSAGCPIGLEVPRLLVAHEPKRLWGAAGGSGVLPPLTGDADHPPVAPVWAFSMRPPRSLRQGKVSAAAIDSRADFPAGVVHLQIHAFEPLEDEERLGRLFVALRYVEDRHDHLASVELDARGAPVGRFRPEPAPGHTFDERAAALLAEADPAKELVALDLGSVADSWSTARTLLREHGDLASASIALHAGQVRAGDDRTAVGRSLAAMAANWRWLCRSAVEIVARDDVLATLAGPATPARAAARAEAATALRWIEEAAHLHELRCSAPDGVSCVCDWFIESGRGLALAACGDWPACERSARRAIALHAGQPAAGGRKAVDQATLALALHGLARKDEAEAALREAETALREAEIAAEPDDHRGRAGGLAPRLCARARSVITTAALTGN